MPNVLLNVAGHSTRRFRTTSDLHVLRTWPRCWCLMSGAPAIPHSPLRSVLTFRPLSLPGQRAKGISCFVLGPSGHCVRLRASGLWAHQLLPSGVESLYFCMYARKKFGYSFTNFRSRITTRTKARITTLLHTWVPLSGSGPQNRKPHIPLVPGAVQSLSGHSYAPTVLNPDS